MPDVLITQEELDKQSEKPENISGFFAVCKIDYDQYHLTGIYLFVDAYFYNLSDAIEYMDKQNADKTDLDNGYFILQNNLLISAKDGCELSVFSLRCFKLQKKQEAIYHVFQYDI